MSTPSKLQWWAEAPSVLTNAERCEMVRLHNVVRMSREQAIRYAELRRRMLGEITVDTTPATVEEAR
jgi:hypothetical protein